MSSEFWGMIGGKMLEESNARVNMAEKDDRKTSYVKFKLFKRDTV